MNSVRPDGTTRNPFIMRMSTPNQPSCIEQLDAAKNLYTDNSLLESESCSEQQSRTKQKDSLMFELEKECKNTREKTQETEKDKKQKNK